VRDTKPCESPAKKPRAHLQKRAPARTVPSDFIRLVAPAERESVAPARSTTSGIFPFGFGREPEATVGVPPDGLENGTRVDSLEKPARPSDVIPRHVFDRVV